MAKYLVAKSYFGNCYKVYRDDKNSLYGDVVFSDDNYDICLLEAKRLNTKPTPNKPTLTIESKPEQLRMI